MITQTTSQENLNQYHTARKHGGWRKLTDSGALLARGEDRLSFFQRQTTNDLRTLTDLNFLVSVLTSPMARILDVLTIIQLADSLLVMTLPGREISTKTYLQSRIFFMDKVSIHDPEQSVEQYEIFGPAVTQFLQFLGIQNIEKQYLQTTSHLNEPIIILGPQVTGLLGCRLLVPVPAEDALRRSLAEHGFLSVTPETYEILRVESGIPGENSELTEEYTPLETGLESAISNNKGCYTGQEVIARQVTYDKVTRHITGLKIHAEASTHPKVGSQINIGGQPIGKLTSCVFSPALGWIGLSILKRPYNSQGQEVEITSDVSVPAEVVDLPHVDMP